MGRARFLAAAIAAALLAACSSSKKADAGPTAPPSDDCGGTNRACLTGAVTVASAADAPGASDFIKDAQITLADGTVLGTTNEQGWFFVRGVPAGQSVPVCFETPSHARRCRNITAAGGQNVQVSNTGLLARNGFTGAVVPSAGGTITFDASTSITFPANAACKEGTSTAASGTVACALTPIVGADPTQRSAAPGNFRGRQLAGAESQLVTGGMIEIVCRDAGGAGAKVNVCSGQTVTVRFPVDAATCSDTALHPATMKSWGFDEATGLWKEYGTFTKTCGAASYYEGAVNHFSYWNADDPIQTTCATGHVLDNAGAPVYGALVRCDGQAGVADGYQGPSEAYSGTDGSFCVPVRRNSSFSCIARKGAFVSTALTGHSGDNTNVCGTGPCTALGNFALTDPLARIVLTWGQYPSDLDSHLVGADYSGATFSGTHVWYSEPGSLLASPFIELDTDDVSSFGPEVISIVHGAKAQRYRYCVHNYSGYSAGPPMESLPTSGATVDAFLGGGHYRLTVPTAASQLGVWRLLEFTLDTAGNAGNVRVINDLVDEGSDVATACMR